MTKKPIGSFRFKARGFIKMRDKEMIREIHEYLRSKWIIFCAKGWEPSCGEKIYIRRNTPYVLRNLRENPEYLKGQVG